ncbi:MAG: rane protein [Phycisphaerales bacterium]|nr:rane protein [Phycisphaerales bacterium]
MLPAYHHPASEGEVTTASRPHQRHPARSRLTVGLALAAVVALGLFSRTPAGRLPWATKEVGDVLFATMFYLWIVLLAPRTRPAVAFGTAVAVTFAIEFLKLYQAPWLDAVRKVQPFGFLLGRTFYWHDLACYVLGAAFGVVLDRVPATHRSPALGDATIP